MFLSIWNFLHLRKRTIVNVLSSKTRDLIKPTLEEVLVKFNLNDVLEINIIDPDELKSTIKLDLDPKFIENTNETPRVDFKSIINHFSEELAIKSYNSNLKSTHLEAELSSPLVLAYWSQVNSASEKNPIRWIHVCTNGDMYQREKADLIVRALSPLAISHVEYVPVGHVSGGLSALECYSQREAYFRHAAIQRQMIPDESLVESNLASLSLFSIVYDLLATGHHKDVKLTACIDPESDNESKLSEQAAFVLYNCARINAILEKFNSRVKQSITCLSNLNIHNFSVDSKKFLFLDSYGELQALESLNFHELFSSEMEKSLCEKHLFKLGSSIKDLINSIRNDHHELEIRLGLAQLVRFSAELSNSFSKYYSKVHVLEVI